MMDLDVGRLVVQDVVALVARGVTDPVEHLMVGDGIPGSPYARVAVGRFSDLDTGAD